MSTSTYEFGRAIEESRSAEARLIARGIAQLCIEDNPLFHSNIAISEVAVYNGSGDLQWINWEARVFGITYETAQRVREYIRAHGINVCLSEDMPDGVKTYGMFTMAGADALRSWLDETEQKLRDGELSPIKLRAWVEAIQESLEKRGHGEVHDTAVRELIWDHLDGVLAELGIQLLEV